MASINESSSCGDTQVINESEGLDDGMCSLGDYVQLKD